MAEYVVMPKLGFDMREGVLVSWLKDIGDVVEKGDVVAEIESDKATLELESQVSGTLLILMAAEGDVVPIGGNLAIVGNSTEDVSEMVKQNGAESSTDEERAEPTAEKVMETVGQERDQADQATSDFPGGVKATPVARRIAEEAGIDLSQISGTGPGGRIRKADVEQVASVPVGLTRPEVTLTGTGRLRDSEEISTSRLRQAIGRRMVESKTTVPHFYVTTEIDMGPALALRKELNALVEDDERITVNDMILKATALALLSFPNLNASYAGEKLIRHGHISVGTAVAVEGGLLTIVQQNTDMTPLPRIAAENRAMIARSREGKSRPADFEGGTFTVSNLGAYDVDHFIAIINPPNAGILAVGTASEVPVVVDGQLAVGWRMKATISADHRVTDGAEAARFVQEVKSILEQPLRLLL